MPLYRMASPSTRFPPRAANSLKALLYSFILLQHHHHNSNNIVPSLCSNVIQQCLTIIYITALGCFSLVLISTGTGFFLLLLDSYFLLSLVRLKKRRLIVCMLRKVISFPRVVCFSFIPSISSSHISLLFVCVCATLFVRIMFNRLRTTL